MANLDKYIKIFSLLDKKVEYVYLRDRIFFERIIKTKEENTKDDIDLLVKKKDAKKVVKILLENGYVTLKKSSVNSRDLSLKNVQDKTMLEINVHIDDLVKMPYVKGRKLLKDRVKEKYIYCLSPKNKLLVLLVKDLFVNGWFSVKKYSKSKKKEIIKLLKNKTTVSYVKREISSIFGEKIAIQIIDLAKKKEFEKITTIRSKIRYNGLLRSNIFRKSFIKNIFGHMKSVRRNKSFFIAFTGVDGCGKTTTIDELVDVLRRFGIKSQCIYMGRWSGYLIPIHYLDNNKPKKITLSMNEVHEKKMKKNLLFYLNLYLRDSYFILEYFLRYIIRVLPKRICKKTIISDRYVYDLQLMKNSTWMLKLFVAIMPKPQMTFILYNNPQKVWKRKKELTPKELKRQQDLLFRLRIKNKVSIKTQTVEQTRKDVLYNIAKKISPSLY